MPRAIHGASDACTADHGTEADGREVTSHANACGAERFCPTQPNPCASDVHAPFLASMEMALFHPPSNQ